MFLPVFEGDIKMKETYQLHVAGLTRHLPICPLNDKVSIAGFVVLGDVELTKACARELLLSLIHI